MHEVTDDRTKEECVMKFLIAITPKRKQRFYCLSRVLFAQLSRKMSKLRVSLIVMELRTLIRIMFRSKLFSLLFLLPRDN